MGDEERLGQVREDAEWKGYVKASLEGILKNQNDIQREFRDFTCRINDEIIALRSRVAAWAAIFGSLSGIIIALLSRWLGGG